MAQKLSPLSIDGPKPSSTEQNNLNETRKAKIGDTSGDTKTYNGSSPRKISTDTSSVDQTTNSGAIKYTGGDVVKQAKSLTPAQKAKLRRIGNAAKSSLDALFNGVPSTETSDAVKFKNFLANGMKKLTDK